MRLMTPSIEPQPRPVFAEPPVLQSETQPAAPSRRPILSFIGGVLLPAVTIMIEGATGICAEAFFNPIPTLWHTLMAALVPLGNLLVWWRPRRAPWTNPALLAAVNGYALAIALYYSLRFLPIVPLAIIGLIFVIGILPLSPMLAAWSAVSLRRKLLGRSFPIWPGLAAGAAIIAMVEAPSLIARAGMYAYATGSESTRRRAIEAIRCCGSEQTLRDAGWRRETLPWLRTGMSPSEAQLLYYRVTGKPFDRPAAFRLAPAVTLSSSLLDGSVDPAAALGYLEWTMTFRNIRPWQEEARAAIQLPPGAVVSRATLWIDGEEREAAFGGRAQVREAYERIVSARRDPLLVLTDGPSRIQVRCFPVPPNGEMKIRVGVTAPLSGGRLHLPRMIDTTFASADGLDHSLWIEAPGQTSRRSARELPPFLDFAEPAPSGAWTPDPRQPAKFHIVQRAVQRPLPRIDRLIAVIDDSASMKPLAAEIDTALLRTAGRIRIDAILASDLSVPKQLKASQFAGGIDNVPVLRRAQQIAAERRGTAILWIHGPQPVALSDAGHLNQFWKRRPGIAPLYALQMVGGDNQILRTLEDQPGVFLLHDSIAAAVAKLTATGTETVSVREQVPAVRDREGHRTSAHLARLWANDEALRLIRSGDRNSALELSREFQLVTPVSGAVVLETKAQYDAAGLKPVHPSTVPTVPEPETWALLAIALVIVVVAMRRRRRACPA